MRNEDAIWQPRWQQDDSAPPDFSTSDSIDPREDERGISEEARWRERRACSGDGVAGREVEVSRWAASDGISREHVSVTPRRCHIVSMAIKVSRVRLSTASGVLFEGPMPSGTMHISVPGQKLCARFTPPFDFLHFHVDNSFLCEEGLIGDDAAAIADGRGPLFRDPLAEALGRSLLDPDQPCHPQYVTSVSKAIVLRTMMHQQDHRRCRALPKWRLRKIERYLVDNIGKPINLQDMADAAGLSRMHFAAQFRAATGFRPHEYLLLKRIEQAKIALVQGRMPLVEVAFSVGFNAQAHFSTVFKRFTGKSPAQWKCEYRAQNGAGQ